MNLQHLHAFTIVAQQQSIRSAARVLGLSQPAVTRIMRELERNVQTPLLHRGSKGIELTAFGHALLRRAHLILEEARKAQDELDQMRDGAGGSLNIAISSTAALSMFPQALQRFRERMPRVALTISESAPPHTQDLLEAGRLDFAVLTELVKQGHASDVALSRVRDALRRGPDALSNLPAESAAGRGGGPPDGRGQGQNQGQGQGNSGGGRPGGDPGPPGGVPTPGQPPQSGRPVGAGNSNRPADPGRPGGPPSNPGRGR